jgi:RimJ/RimL family protein N-acetyltransferase
VNAGPELSGGRLLLRRWRDSDLEPFAAINADPVVMEHFPATLSRTQSEVLIERIETSFETDGYGLWAVELVGESTLIGFLGLLAVDSALPFAPAVELGWRLARSRWGEGYATEAATLAIGFAFDELQLGELVSYTAARNARSRMVMERLGMAHDPAEDFFHPELAPTDPLAPHVLYRLTAR